MCSDYGSTEYYVRDVEPRNNELSWPSLINYRDKEIFVIGGRSSGLSKSAPVHTVENYTVATNTWSNETPSLVEARAGASGCSMPGYIYIFCGMKEDRIRLNSIERLRIIADDKPKLFVDRDWQLIQLKPESLAARSNPIIVPMNATKIAILGGLMQKNEEYMGDILLFDTSTKTCNKLVENKVITEEEEAAFD